ncbi:MAG: Mur ligase family protein, partial [Xanthomonadales bacterium]|nr:Mur ligase family protein [Xanthomonadales bacterium]
NIAILNNLEFDHADIYPDIKAIQTQFHHLVRTIPGNGTIISNGQDARLEAVLERGCWSHLERFSEEEAADWRVELLKADGSELAFHRGGAPIGRLAWAHHGRHNALNACAALAAAAAAGVDAAVTLDALAAFRGVKRRMELISEIGDVRVYDDFAHHPTAIRLTLEGLRRSVGNARVLVALEPRSNTMRAGVHIGELGPALIAADRVWLMAGDGIDWDPQEALAPLDGRGRVVTRSDDLLTQMLDAVRAGDYVVFMSNGGFDSAPARFCRALQDHEHH